MIISPALVIPAQIAQAQLINAQIVSIGDGDTITIGAISKRMGPFKIFESYITDILLDLATRMNLKSFLKQPRSP